MPYGKKRNYKRMAKKAVVKSKPSPAKSVSLAVKQYVKRAIHTEIENKQVEQPLLLETALYKSGFSSIGTNIGITTDNIMPSITQSDTQEGRNGNRIKPMSMTVKYLINANPLQQHPTVDGANVAGRVNTCNFYTHAGKPFHVRVVIYSLKDNLDSNDNSRLIQNGISATNLIDIEDMYSYYNKDKYNIHYSKTIKMAANRFEVYADVAGVAKLTNSGSFFNGNAPSTHYGMAKIKLPAKLLFDDTQGDNTPTNFKCYLAAGCVNDDNSEIKSTEYRADITARSFLVFEDA